MLFCLCGHARADRLDELLLQPDELSEAALQQLFGLEETLVRPLADSVLPEPALLVWQKERLRAIWLQQDDATRTVWNTPQPVVDPDMLGEWDLRTPSPGTPPTICGRPASRTWRPTFPSWITCGAPRRPSSPDSTRW